MSGIILGPLLIGEAASRKAQETAVDDAGGGSIQVGPGLKDNGKFKKRALAAQGVHAAPLPKIEGASSAVPELAALPPIAELDLAPEPVAAGLSEDDIEIMLATDPNAWDIVAEAEVKRAEGFRPSVARMLLNAPAQAKEIEKDDPTKPAKPMDDEMVAQFRRIAEVGAVKDAEKLRAAVDASPAVGTGNPDAPQAPNAPKTPKKK